MKNKQVMIFIVVVFIAIIPSLYYFKNEGWNFTGSVVKKSPIFYCSFDDTLECTNRQFPIDNRGLLFSQGIVNQAVLVDSKDKLIYNSKDNIYSDKGTIGFWYKSLGYTNETSALVEDSDSGKCGNFIFRLGSNNKVQFNPKRGTRFNLISNSSLELNKWYHIAVSWDSSQENRLYINGKLEDSKVGSFTSEDMEEQIRVGQPCGAYSFRRANGWIDELKIYDYVRTDVQILEDYEIVPIVVYIDEDL